MYVYNLTRVYNKKIKMCAGKVAIELLI